MVLNYSEQCRSLSIIEPEITEELTPNNMKKHEILSCMRLFTSLMEGLVIETHKNNSMLWK